MTMVRSPTENWRTLPAGKSTIAALSMSRLRVTAVSPEPSQSRDQISQKDVRKILLNVKFLQNSPPLNLKVDF